MSYTAVMAALKRLLPIGDPKAPGKKVIPIYVRMDELRALHALASNPTSADAEDRTEIERLRDVLDVDRYKVAIGVQAIAKACQGRKWLSEPGRGSFAWDDERYQAEFGHALDEIDAALAPLRSIARDWSDCPRDPLRVEANRQAAQVAQAHADSQ